MGKGDKKTRRGKLFQGSYGVLRPKKRKRTFSVVSATRKPVEKAAPKPKTKTAVKSSSKSEESVPAGETVVEPEEEKKTAGKTAEAKGKPDSKVKEEVKEEPKSESADVTGETKALEEVEKEASGKSKKTADKKE